MSNVFEYSISRISVEKSVHFLEHFDNIEIHNPEIQLVFEGLLEEYQQPSTEFCWANPVESISDCIFLKKFHRIIFFSKNFRKEMNSGPWARLDDRCDFDVRDIHDDEHVRVRPDWQGQTRLPRQYWDHSSHHWTQHYCEFSGKSE